MNEDWNEKTTKKTRRKAMCKNMKLVEKELAEGINDNFFVLVTTIGFEYICGNYYKLYMIQLLINVLELGGICAFNYTLGYD
jgi:hypothetical protein